LGHSASEKRRLERIDTDVEPPDTRHSETKGVETKIKTVDETNGKQSVERKLGIALEDLEKSERTEVSENAISSRLSEAFRELEAEEKREQRPLEKQLEDVFKELAVEEALEKNEAAVDTSTLEVEPAKADLHEVENDTHETKEKQQDHKKPTHFEWQEENRIRHESSVHSEALEHRIDPERVGDALSEIRKTGELSPKELTDAVEKMYSTVENPQLGSVHYAELYDTKENLETDWRRGNEVAQRNLSDLMNQLSHLEKIPANRVCRYRKPPYLDGETLHFIGDSTGQSLEDLKSRFSHIGMKEGGRVYNLQFPDIHVYRTVFVAVMGSDGHHALDGWVTYYEKDPERRKLAIDEFQRFGDIDIRMNPKRPADVPLPKVLSSMARHWGIPRGDKAIHNKGLIESVIKEPLEVKVTYLPPVIAEDGCFSGGRFTITRANVLHAGKKAERYREMFGIEPLVTQEHIDFVCEHGNDQDATLNYQEGETVRLCVKTMEELEESEDANVSRLAKDLLRIIWENPNRLLKDEANEMMAPLGIRMTREPRHVAYYRDSGRLSLNSYASSKEIADTTRWALIAPPSHPRKMAEVVKFVRKYQDIVNRVRQEISDDGLSVDSIWEEDGL